MRGRNVGVAQWLYHLDSYTNAEFGAARSLEAIRDACVGCGGPALDPDLSGLCRKCAAQRRPDQTEVVLFRPMRRGGVGTAEPVPGKMPTSSTR